MANQRAVRIGWSLAIVYVVVVLGRNVAEVRQLQHAGLMTPEGWAQTAFFNVAVPIVYGVVALLLVARRPRHPVGWLLLLPALVTGLQIPGDAELLNPPAHPGLITYLFTWFATWSWVLIFFPIFLMPMYFPDGRLPSARWRVIPALALALAGMVVLSATLGDTFSGQVGDAIWSLPNPLGRPLPGAFDGFFNGPLWAAGLMTLAASGVVALVVRYRRAALLVRLQLKWLLYAAAVLTAGYGVLLLTRGDGSGLLTATLLAPGTLGIPLAIGIAILRYRLFDIDVIIRRTLVYAVLTALLALVYFGSVVLFQNLFGALSGVAQSPLAVVVSTLAIAALFTPLRRRIQDTIDRRFYRQKYDAQQVLARFALTARDETDLDALTGELAQVVQETMQPERVSVWLRNN